MGDATAEFFADLKQRGHEPRLGSTSGSVRIELTDGGQTERWLVSLDRGDLAVSRRSGAADSTVRAEKAVFDRLVSGELNAVTALLRGEMAAEGNLDVLVLFQRLFPGPSRAS
ncbi:MAG TPA: SCP2 sterol-binding domain-containing protein [Gaiellaceae bacterium]|jgi:putative sterol carrier protein